MLRDQGIESKPQKRINYCEFFSGKIDANEINIFDESNFNFLIYSPVCTEIPKEKDYEEINILKRKLEEREKVIKELESEKNDNEEKSKKIEVEIKEMQEKVLELKKKKKIKKEEQKTFLKKLNQVNFLLWICFAQITLS